MLSHTQKIILLQEEIKRYKAHVAMLHADMDSEEFESYFTAEMVLQFLQAVKWALKIDQEHKLHIEKSIAKIKEKIEHASHKIAQHTQAKEEQKQSYEAATFNEIMEDIFYTNQLTEYKSIFTIAQEAMNEKEALLLPQNMTDILTNKMDYYNIQNEETLSNKINGYLKDILPSSVDTKDNEQMDMGL